VTQQERYMLMFSLGPVQTFIAQARKTRDLSLGSYLPAKLMEAALKELKGDLVYPTDRIVDSERDIPNIPNKFVAIFQSAEEAYDEVEKCKTRIKKRWSEIQDRVWRAIVENYATNDTERIWKRQTNPNSLFETFWVIVSGKPEEYKQWLKHTQQVFDARKRLRDFEPQVDGEAGEKSTISGEREALRGEGSDRKTVQAFWVSLTTNLSPHDISKDGSERLDAIDTIKRFATESRHIPNIAFPSTSSIATAAFVEGLFKNGMNANALDNWLRATNGPLAKMPTDTIPYLSALATQRPELLEVLNRDGDCYFAETFTPYRLKKDYALTDEDQVKQHVELGPKSIRDLPKIIEGSPVSRPTPYYAMIQMDGDRMGILLNGVANDQEHRAISTALSKFARKFAPDLIEEKYPARLVYAGGDDVFALAPLARDIRTLGSIVTVIELVDQLQRKYQEEVVGALPSDATEERRGNVTASIGIAIAHHYTSLSYVRRVAKSSEELAKEHYGRNALVATVIRRSGEQTRVGCHWRYTGLADEGQPISLATRFYELFKYDMLSPKCVYALLEEAPTLVKLEQKAQQSEIKRVFVRQSSDSKLKKLDEIERLSEHLVNLAVAMDNDDKRKQDITRSVELHSDKRRYGLVEVLGWLLVAAFLARKDRE